MTDQVLGNNLVQQFCYDANTLRLNALRVYPGALQACGTTPSTPSLNLSYSYQANGNVNQIVDATRSETLNYTYDELDRLLTAGGAYSQNYAYNAIGNMTTKNTATYTYGDAAHKHAVTGLSTGESYTYDADGNMITRVEGGITYTQTFDAENRLVSITASGNTTSFVYDGDGHLVRKTNPDGTYVLYVSGIYESYRNANGTTSTTKTFYPAGGAMRVDGTRYYILKDLLGSASVVTNQSATTVGEDRFYPFGETRFTTGNMQTDKLFTGQRQITGLGIYHFGARFYSPKLGRFLSADTIVPDYANPQNLNRFSYVTNNPLRYIDPTGHKYCDNQQPDDCTRFSQSYEHTTIKLRIRFKGNGGKGDKEAFVNAMSQEADKMYDAYCQNQPSCEFSSPEDLYVATHGTTVITFSNSSSPGGPNGYYCERNANVGEEGVICWANSKDKIDPILAAHEMAHVFNALIANNGQTTPYTDMAGERATNPDFPPLNVDITDGYIKDRATSSTPGEDYANMYSMWVFDDWPDSTGGKERRKFMNDNMRTWILRMLNP